MKSPIALILFSLLHVMSFAQSMQGAWKRELDTATQYLTIVDGYFSVATFNLAEKRFIRTEGGISQFEKERMSGKIEFCTSDRSQVGKSYAYPLKLEGKKLELPIDGLKKSWEKVDDAVGGLSGNWRIISREQDGKMIPMKPGARKTIKILSATHFQWIAINTETGDFFGTGGGEYSFNDGKYTERIQFFSRDPQRVGASLGFNAELKDGDWHHSGLSSKGDRIYEVWSRK